MTWSIAVLSAAGVAKATLTPVDHVVSLDAFEVFPGGDCGEATITALAASVDIAARDVITISVDGVARYRGVCVQAGSPEGHDPQRFRFAGLRSRLYEVTTPTAVVTGADVAVMASDVWASVVAASQVPVGITGIATLPSATFVLGDRFPALESVGEALDALAETVGAFIVPTGETYTYDGHTYQAGDAVPAVRWGVSADGVLYFRRPAEVAPLAVSEASDAVVLRWQTISAERVVDSVRLVYAAGYVTEELEAFWILTGPGAMDRVEAVGAGVPLSRVFTSGDGFGSERVVPIDGPLDYMVEHADATFSADVTNPANAFDGDPATYAEVTSPAADGTLQADVNGTPEGLLYYDVSVTDYPAEVGFYISYRSAGDEERAWQPYGMEVLDTDGVGRHRRVFSALAPAELAHVTDWHRLVVLFVFTPNVRVHRLGWFVPDVDRGGLASERLASGFFVGVPPAVASIELLGVTAPVRDVVVAPMSGAAAIPLRIERTVYTLSTERGATTTHFAGQPYEGDLMAQRAVLEALAGREARKRERARL